MREDDPWSLIFGLWSSQSSAQDFFSWKGLWLSGGPEISASPPLFFSQYSIRSLDTSETFLREMCASIRSCSVCCLIVSIMVLQ
ncbi:hypothetical protein PFISCL1PPCAC_25473 [Pristionchus fissidentatus]|uniref:Uncharacterized protein n=1 Tax=Pristionchus fissidentatus TaxID=1538716 RepID=A0AAV5WT55_9BILA|nr:hypothetical protein PFISCL1PPCAC_25473 [Pristionchus fissidentatus]